MPPTVCSGPQHPGVPATGEVGRRWAPSRPGFTLFCLREVAARLFSVAAAGAGLSKVERGGRPFIEIASLISN